MKAPGGARDVLAGGAHRADGAHDDDSKLRALRAVWLEMRDEEPSDRGLADLLAAARTKAATMQVRPTPWQRLVAGLRRPPALALATVMVLVGGAMILGRRGLDDAEPIRAPGAVDRMVGAPMAQPVVPAGGPVADGYAAPADRLAKRGSGNAGASPEADLVTTEPDHTGAAPKPGSVTTEPASSGAAPDSASREAALGGRAVVREASAKVEPSPTTPAGRSGEAAPARRVADASAGDQIAAGNDGMLRSRPQPPPALEAASTDASRDARSAEANRPQASVADDAAAPRPAPGVRSPPDAAGSTSDAERVEPSAKASDREQAPPAVPLAQLYQQCEAAARRGDCAAVRLMVGRITRTDRSYRARVAKDSPVAKCLAE